MSTQQQPTWNPRRKAAVAVLVLAVAGLGIDRFVLGVAGPESASAHSYAIGSEPNKLGANSVVDAKQTAKASRDQVAVAVSLAQRLDAARPSSKVQPSQMFIAPIGFFPFVVEARAPAGEAVAARVPGVRSVPLPKLTAVITGPNGGAILDGRLQRIGEVRDGVTLISVSDRSAVVRTSQSDVVLTIDDTMRELK